MRHSTGSLCPTDMRERPCSREKRMPILHEQQPPTTRGACPLPTAAAAAHWQPQAWQACGALSVPKKTATAGGAWAPAAAGGTSPCAHTRPSRQPPPPSSQCNRPCSARPMPKQQQPSSMLLLNQACCRRCASDVQQLLRLLLLWLLAPIAAAVSSVPRGRGASLAAYLRRTQQPAAAHTTAPQATP